MTNKAPTLMYAEGYMLDSKHNCVVVKDDCASDAQGFPVSGMIGDAYVARLAGSKFDGVVHGRVSYSGDGQYPVNYKPMHAGTYELTVQEAHRYGLKAEYWNNRRLWNEPLTTGVDGTIDFEWPDYVTETGVDYIGVRWTGYIKPAFTQVYKFYAHANDGTKVWVNGELLIDEFESQRCFSEAQFNARDHGDVDTAACARTATSSSAARPRRCCTRTRSTTSRSSYARSRASR